MAKLRINGDTSGYVDITVPAVAGAATLDVTSPTFTGPVVQKTSGNGGSLLAVGSANQSGYLSLTNAANSRVAYVGWAGADSGNLEIVTDSGTNLGVRMSTNGLERLKIDTSGRVTIPYQPAFIASHSSSYYGAQTALAYYTWNSTVLNVGNHYNTSNGRFTAPITGKYFFFLNARLDSTTSGGYLRAYVAKNGGTYENPNLHAIFGQSHSTDYHTLSVSGILYLNANDYVQSGGGHNTGSSNLLTSESTFGGYFLG